MAKLTACPARCECPSMTISQTCKPAVNFAEPAQSSEARPYVIRGNPDEMRAELQKWDDLDVEFLALWFGGDSPDALVTSAERFMRDVAE